MRLFKQVSIDQAVDLAFLHPNERLRYDAMGSDVAKQQFALGRCLAKQAYCELSGDDRDVADIEIRNGCHGHPYVSGSDFQVSVSHCKAAVVAVCSEPGAIIGIDVETLDRSTRAIRRYCSAAERALVPIADDEHAYLCLWSLKEALSKALRLGFLIDFRMLAISECHEKDEGYGCKFSHISGMRGVFQLQKNVVVSEFFSS